MWIKQQPLLRHSSMAVASLRQDYPILPLVRVTKVLGSRKGSRHLSYETVVPHEGHLFTRQLHRPSFASENDIDGTNGKVARYSNTHKYLSVEGGA
jgi:hypothetical protein